MAIEKWKKDSSNIDYMEDAEYGTLGQSINLAKSLLDMYNESGATFYNDLYCDEFKDKEKNKRIRANARKHITKLKNYIKKYGGK